MKINNREKIYLIVLLVVIVLFLGYKFGYTKYEDYEANLQAEHDAVQAEYDDVQFAIKAKSAYEDQLNKNGELLEEKSKGYIYQISQENLIIELDDLFTGNDINVSSVSFSEITDLFGEEDGLASDDSVKKIDLAFNFSCDYDDLLNFIDEMQLEKNKIGITNLVIVSGEGGVISGNMNAEFFAAKNEFTLENDYEWIDLIDSGKDNPFDASSLSTGNYNRNYDFILNLKPTSSDLPTVTLQKVGEETASSLYEDENSAVPVTFTIIQENGVYKYTYTVGTQNYPANGSYIEFDLAESDSLGLKIYSVERNSQEDTSGVQITIDNQTDLAFYATIIDDDSIRPRAVFKNTGGVNITNE